MRNEHAITAFEGNFRRSLLLTLANLDATAKPDDLYERFTGGVVEKHNEILDELRRVLSRAPSFAGRYQVAGFDPAGLRVALLRQGEAELRVLNLQGKGGGQHAKLERYDLPAPAQQNSLLRPAVGFVAELGPAALVSNRLGYVEIPPQRIVVASTLPKEAWRLQPARIPWVYPPFAAVKIGQHWRAAWLAPNGIWAVESSDRDPGTAELIFGIKDPLIGEPDGATLQFTRDGEFLVMQRVQFPLQVLVRVWDLRASRRAWMADASTTERELRAAACRVVRMEGGNGAFDDMASRLFQIDPEHRKPCPEVAGVGS